MRIPMEIAVLGIDLGKAVCSVAGVGGTGAVVMRNRVQPFRLVEVLAQLPSCVVRGSLRRRLSGWPVLGAVRSRAAPHVTNRSAAWRDGAQDG